MKQLIPFVIFALVLLAVSPLAETPGYDLLIKGGHLIDPRNRQDGPADVAIREEKIAHVAPTIDPTEARKVIDAAGMYIIPDLIDLYTHVFFGTEEDSAYSNGYSAVSPDRFTFRSGVTTVVDAGGAGWRSFRRFKRQTIDHFQTRVLAFINIVGAGMKGGPRIILTAGRGRFRSGMEDSSVELMPRMMKPGDAETVSGRLREILSNLPRIERREIPGGACRRRIRPQGDITGAGYRGRLQGARSGKFSYLDGYWRNYPMRCKIIGI